MLRFSHVHGARWLQAFALMSLCAMGCRGAGPERVLVFSKTSWYRHEAIPKVNAYLAKMGAEHGFAVDVTEDASVFTPENLARYQIVVFNNTTDIGKSLDDAQKEAFVAWFRAGGGFLGLHSASVHHKTWPWYERMLGTDFNSDVERQEGIVRVDPAARDHPAVRGFGPELRIGEEWMNYESSPRGVPGTTVLLTLDESSIDTTVKVYFQDKGGRPMGGDHPISWLRRFEGGRAFYTNFGHDERALETDFGRAHILGGLRWAAGEGP
jgi:type 1 glutamine amidotransferase